MDLFDLTSLLVGPGERDWLSFQARMWVYSTTAIVGVCVLGIIVYLSLLVFAPQLHLPSPVQLFHMLNQG
jgi:hypothetical protein